MEHKTVNIYGSCVCRECFNFFPLKDSHCEINNYIQKNSINTLLGDGLDIAPSFVLGDSNYLKRVTYYDLTKKTVDILKNDLCDYLIIDFAEIRFGIINISFNGKNFNCTNHLSAKKTLLSLQKNCEFSNMQLDFSENPHYYSLEKITHSINLFADFITKYYPPQKIIVVGTRNCYQYIDDDGSLKSFDNLLKISLENDLIQTMTNLFVEKLKNECYHIKLPHTIISNKYHWLGFSPLHYSDSCYRYLSNCIYLILDQNCSHSALNDLYKDYYNTTQEEYRKLSIKTNLIIKGGKK